jgi:hypothetical protein
LEVEVSDLAVKSAIRKVVKAMATYFREKYFTYIVLNVFFIKLRQFNDFETWSRILRVQFFLPKKFPAICFGGFGMNWTFQKY